MPTRFSSKKPTGGPVHLRHGDPVELRRDDRENAGVVRATGGCAVEIDEPIAAVLPNDGTISGVAGEVGVSTRQQGTSATIVEQGIVRGGGVFRVEGPGRPLT